MFDPLSEQKKDRRMLVLFLFGLLLLTPDLFSFIGSQSALSVNSCFFNKYTGAGESEALKQAGRFAPRLAFFFNQPMSINKASLQDLTLLPGIGEQLAGRIIAYRNYNHGIHDGAELERIPGIGKKIQHKICAFVTFEQP